jgi:hypothetical protein
MIRVVLSVKVQCTFAWLAKIDVDTIPIRRRVGSISGEGTAKI